MAGQLGAGESVRKVLIIEDSLAFQQDFASALADRVHLLQAFSLAEGFQLFDQNQDVAAIFCDGCLDGGGFDALPLVQHIRNHWGGPLVSISSSPSLRRAMVAAGCSAQCLKGQVPDYVRDLGLI